MMPHHKNRKFIVIPTVIFIFLSISLIPHLEVNETIIPMLPDSEPMARDFKFFMEHIPAGENLYIDIESLSSDMKALESGADAFYTAIRESSFFSDIIYRFSHDQYLKLLATIGENKASLLDEEGISLLGDRLTPEKITARVFDIKR
ncbi:MAG: hypothetical protein HQK66_10645, partial [Desulfamplus sp.]|nr:hypothetical protein [Desulfamplus sp.]